VKESALRKKVMWANVMKKFIHQAAQRSMCGPSATKADGVQPGAPMAA
jgi:hypothetical protein